MKVSIFLCFVLFLAYNLVYSQQSFIPHNITYGSYTGQITLADIDEDNDLDLLAAYSKDNLIAWYMNNGNGIFDNMNIIDDSAEDKTGTLFATDLDNDGHIDVIYGGLGTLGWYKNLGNGIFSPPQIISINVSYVSGIFAIDLDGDSLTDILSATWSDNKIAWYKNFGNGNFGNQQIISTNTSGATNVWANYLDNDDLIDVVSSSYYDDKIAWYKNLGGGSFGPQQILTDTAEGASFVMTADLDNDNLADIITSHSGGTNNKVTWHKNLGGGIFSPEIIINNSLEIPRYFFPADFNNDNELDLVLTSWNQDSLVWKENLGGGNFGPNQLISETLDGANGVYAGDLNGDGSMDIVGGGTNSSTIEVYINHGMGLFNLTQTISNATADVFRVYADDLDNDGLIDILSASSADNKIAWYKNQGNKQFSLQKVISTNRFDARDLVAADLDNDGLKDVISAAKDDTLAWHKNMGNGTFGIPQKIPNALKSNIVLAKDLDNDGLIDIVVALSDTVRWTRNLGNGNFGPLNFLLFLQGLNDFDIEDLNSDGYQDIVYGSGSTLMTSLNDGTGGFLPFQYINTINGAISLCLNDMNDDGSFDIVYSGTIGSTKVVKWYPNDGLGNFTTSYLLTDLPYYCYTIDATDIDNDNDLDVVMATGGGNTSTGVVYWIENLGTGNFAQLQPIDSLAGSMRCIFPKDLDNDNDNDLIIALQGNDQIKWLENPLNNLMETITICAEDSAHVFGNWVSQPGDYADTLTNSQGGDSINIVRVENYQTYFPTDTVEICQGETYNFHGQLLDTAGLYQATFQSIHGCDSIEELPLVLIPAPEVSVSSFVPDSVSIDTGFIDMPGATPTGGYYMGTGVTTYGFNSTFAGLGEHWITYTYTDTITGCTGMDSTLIKVYDPIGINEIEAQNIKLYPNPGTGDFVLTGTALESVRISSLDGELVKQLTITNPIEVRFSLKGQAKGTYLLHILNDGVEIKRILVLI